MRVIIRRVKRGCELESSPRIDYFCFIAPARVQAQTMIRLGPVCQLPQV